MPAPPGEVLYGGLDLRDECGTSPETESLLQEPVVIVLVVRTAQQGIHGIAEVDWIDPYDTEKLGGSPAPEHDTCCGEGQRAQINLAYSKAPCHTESLRQLAGIHQPFDIRDGLF